MQFKPNQNSIKAKVKQTQSVAHENNAAISQLAGLVREQMEFIGNISRRLAVAEDLLLENTEVSLEDIENRITDKEDAAWGLEKVDDSVQEGDCLRISLQAKAKDASEFDKETRVMVTNVALEPFALDETFDKNLLGLKSGEARQFESGERVFSVKVNKISRKKAGK